MSAEIKLQHELKKRINESDPSKNDLDYYQRKVRRLENQLSISQDELSRMRVKLKRAEDFQFKYELLFKQFANLKADNDSKTKEINMLQTLNEQLKLNLQEKASNLQDFSLQKTNLLQQIATWKQRYQQLQHQSKIDLQDERIRSHQTIKLNQQKIRSQYKQRQQDMTYQIHQLKKALKQKQTVEDIIGQRVDKIRTEKDEEINRLKGILTQRKESYDNYMKEKNEELQRMKEKFEKMINFDIENLKNNQEDQEEIFSIQLNGLREMIGLKNDQIEKLLAEINRMAKEHQANRRQLLQEITILKQKIYTVEKEADIELQNLKDRLIAIHAQDVRALEERHENISDTLRNDLDDTRKYIRELERMQQNLKNEFEKSKGQFHDRLKQKDKRISDLLDSLRSRGQVNASELKSLHESFHMITSQKQVMASEYQTNVTFMNQQIAKLNSISEIKTKEITKLHEEIHSLKITYEERLSEWEAKYRKQRREREEEREQQRSQRDKLNERLQDQQRDFKNQLRRLQRQRQKLQKQKVKADYMLQEAQRDIDRLNKYIKQLDDSLKSEFKKNQLSTLDKDGLRREILSELEKQKVELEAMKLMEVDQMRKKYEMENARLVTSNQQLKTQILNKSIAFENMQSEFKKLDYRHRNADKLQRDKIKQYQHKMITLTQEIGITQNLYQAFLDAKARAEQ